MEKHEVFKTKKLTKAPKDMKKYEKFIAMGKSMNAKKAQAKAVQDAKVATEAVVAEYLNMKVRVVHEDFQTIFGQEGEVTKELGDDVLIKMEDAPISYKVRKDAVEILSYLVKASVQKPLNLNRGDKEILFAEFRDICTEPKEGLQMNEMASGDHLKLGWYIIKRDLISVQGAIFADPAIIYQISHGIQEKTEESLEIVKKASLILLMQFYKAGILGLPIWAQNHWTLCVFRKLGKVTEVRYYDSLKEPSSISQAVADHILQFIRKMCADEWEFPEVLPARTNTRSWQINGVDCAFFCLHYWEGECRRWIGEGWSLNFPTTSNKGLIYKMRARMISLIGQMQKIPAEREKAKAKAKAKEDPRRRGWKQRGWRGRQSWRRWRRR